MLGPFATASRRTSIHQVSLPVLSHAACASMSTTTTTTTTRDRGDRYGPMEWAQQYVKEAVFRQFLTQKHALTNRNSCPATLTVAFCVGPNRNVSEMSRHLFAMRRNIHYVYVRLQRAVVSCGCLPESILYAIPHTH